MSSRFLCLICLPALMVTCYDAIAQDDSRREEAIAKLIQIQAEKAGVLLDDNALNAVLLRFRRVNPDAPEEIWRQIKSGVKASFLRLLSEKSGPFALSVREIMPQFTTDDIEKLVVIHSDPLFLKYNDAAIMAMKKPNAEFSMRMAIERSVVEINDLLIKRGLKPAY